MRSTVLLLLTSLFLFSGTAIAKDQPPGKQMSQKDCVENLNVEVQDMDKKLDAILKKMKKSKDLPKPDRSDSLITR